MKKTNARSLQRDFLEVFTAFCIISMNTYEPHESRELCIEPFYKCPENQKKANSGKVVNLW